MKEKILVVFLMVGMLSLVAFASAGTLNNAWDKITGKVTSSPLSQNITVTGGSAPIIYDVWNETMTDMSSGTTEDSPTYVIINFSVSDAEGASNIDTGSAFINLEFGGTSRSATCTEYQSSGNYANYTCNATIWWFDAPGTWTINASISDTNTNYGENTTDVFDVGTTAGFASSPSGLSWAGISPGATNIEPSDNILMNNTGNLARNIQVNATDLVGETNSAQALWAANFSAHTAAGCGGTAMVADTYTAVTGASLPAGNYTLNDGTGQENLYICLEAANTVLDAQAYSTAANGAWTVKITA